MNILVCGARGFIGGHIVQALQAAGHTVVRGLSRAASDNDLKIDFSADTSPAVWRTRLAGIDAVVNAVGVLRDTTRRPMSATHLFTPMALFNACAQAGVRRVVHVSALGIHNGDTSYARTKQAAEAQLLQRNAARQLDGVVLRPSIVYGPSGAAAGMFDGLSHLPVLPLPAEAIGSQVQPVHVADLAEAVVKLIGGSAANFNGTLDVVGPRAMSLAEFIGELRAARGSTPARVCALPERFTRWSVRVGDALPVTPWGSQALALLCSETTGDFGPLQTLLGRAPLDPAQFNAEPEAAFAPGHA